MRVVILIPSNEPHGHPEVDFRDGDEDRGVSLTDHLVNSEESFIMPCECIRKNGCQILADCSQCVARDVSGNNVFDVLVAGKDVSAVCAVLDSKSE